MPDIDLVPPPACPATFSETGATPSSPGPFPAASTPAPPRDTPPEQVTRLRAHLRLLAPRLRRQLALVCALLHDTVCGNFNPGASPVLALLGAHAARSSNNDGGGDGDTNCRAVFGGNEPAPPAGDLIATSGDLPAIASAVAAGTRGLSDSTSRTPTSLPLVSSQASPPLPRPPPPPPARAPPVPPQQPLDTPPPGESVTASHEDDEAEAATLARQSFSSGEPGADALALAARQVNTFMRRYQVGLVKEKWAHP